jgi:hypothetical protein
VAVVDGGQWRLEAGEGVMNLLGFSQVRNLAETWVRSLGQTRPLDIAWMGLA